MKNLIIIILLFIIHSTINNQQSMAQTWDTVPGRLSGGPTRIESFYAHNNLLYVGGCFEYAGTLPVSCIATWDGITWDSLGSGETLPYLTPNSIIYYNNEIYNGGEFGEVGYIPNTRGIARWNGIEWNSVGTGLTAVVDDIYALEVYNGELYAGGDFSLIGGLNVYSIAKWDGSNWYDVGNVYGQIRSMALYDGCLYVGGMFSSAGGVTAYNIARWNGSIWDTVGVVGLGGAVGVLAVDTIIDVLYASGGFGIGRWDGNNWTRLSWGATGDSVPGGYGLIVYHGEVYSGGSSIGCNSDGDTLKYISRWDGKKWKPCGEGTNNTVSAFGVYKDTLYVGGYFKMAGGDSAFYIAKWHTPPCAFQTADFGISADTVYLSDSAIVQFYDSSTTTAQWYWDFGDSETDTIQNPVHSYNSAGTYQVMLISTYGECSDTAAYKNVTVIDDVGMSQVKIKNYELKIYPNPTEENFTVETYVSGDENGIIKIYGIKGELLKKYKLNKGNNRTLVHTSGWEKGIYICNLMIDGKVMKSEKMVVE